MIFTYCPNCKAKLKRKLSKKFYCVKCGFEYFHNTAATMAAILKNSKAEIMLVKRKFCPNKGFWDLPGGFVDYGETFEEGLRRELWEELRIRVPHLHYVSSDFSVYVYKETRYPVIIAAYSGIVRDAHKIWVHDDVDAIRFFSRNKIPWARLAFPGLKRILKEYTK